MLYYLFQWLHKIGLPGSGVLQYISVRAALAFVCSLVIAIFFGKSFIGFLRKKQIGESVRDLGLQGQNEKAGTPTMGGLIIIAAILVPVLLFCNLSNIYILLMIFTTVWLGTLGFMDDFYKMKAKKAQKEGTYKKQDKDGIAPRTKLLGQVILGVIVGVVMFFHPDATICEKTETTTTLTPIETALQVENQQAAKTPRIFGEPHHSTKTTIPFVKNHELNYSWLTSWFGDKTGKWAFLLFIPIVIFIIAAVSNGANLTDGIDGLAAGTTATIALGIAFLAYVSGNVIFADYLNIMYIPHIGELVIFVSALVGACLGFYWWNCFPAQIFMGDTGSLTLGGIVAVSCIIIRKELLIPILCGIYLIETVSVILQTSYFKYTKKKYGEGKRIFLMSPIHHHFQRKGVHENKIVQRFILVSLILVALTLVTLKIR